ncbi:bidirectional sugar transporter SWEET7b-like [Mercurialis annua]|uniref:bidirectional sugar transporter SWEET7b-like n=1 Tax=Mercurialis annua TaxID=3986 RepID=UPI00215F9251|nr:bidirectional sugar transporter SWEET7b-like [Mercurialis annua]
MVSLHSVVGIIGNVISFGLFLSPIPTFYRIFKKKDVEEFQFYPYVATVLNCMLWIFYGLPYVTKDNILVVIINAIGLFIELVYLSVFLFYDKHNRGRKRVFTLLAGEVVFMVVIIAVAMLAIPRIKTRGLVVGIFCDILNVMMYFSPLLIMKKVYKTKSVEFMPFYLSLANFLNGACWFIYGLLKLDIFILISNGLGALGGLAQLGLYCWYRIWYPYKHRGDADGKIVKPAGIQLSTANPV